MSEIKVNSIKGVSATSAAININNTDGTCTANITNNLSNRNKVINGAMICSQRTISASVTGSTNAYVALDRFKSRNVHDGAYTLSQSTTSPDGFANSLKVDVTTADTSLASNVRATIEHFIEAQDLQDLGYGTSSAKTITVSFYVRSNKTGNYGFSIEQADNGFKQVTLQYTINSADTWERKTFTIAGDTSGVINNDEGSGLELYWWLAAGSTYTSGSTRTTYTAYANGDFGAGQAVNLLDSTSNEWYITGVQLEVNSSGVATDFEHRSFADELRRCQRYYAKYQAGTNYSIFLVTVGYGSNETDSRCKFDFVTEMRTPLPSFSYSSGSHFQDMSGKQLNIFLLADNGGTTKFTSMRTLFSQSFADAGKAYVIRAANNSDAYFEFDTEL